MKYEGYSIRYPRRRVIRGALRGGVRLLLRLLARVKIAGEEHLPRGGPLIVVGNHAAILEAPLMMAVTPWQIEGLLGMDVPHEAISQVTMGLYGYISIQRGAVDRRGLTQALDVLAQGGVVGLYPEGGIWQQGVPRAKRGVAWLSYHAQAPVLPMTFVGTEGALEDALRFRRPELTITIGKLIPPAQASVGQHQRAALQAYADHVLAAVYDLLPEEKRQRALLHQDETFELHIEMYDKRDKKYFSETRSLPHGPAVAKFLHSPRILKIFRRNLHFPVEPLERLHEARDPAAMAEAARSILRYLREVNPHFLTYRLGFEDGLATERGLAELLESLQWAADFKLAVHIQPIWRHYDPESGEMVTQIEQGRFEHWM
ncbi:MAG: lysophospholipid acyltransferase family protein [Anaerolineales bacterium]